MNTYAHRWQLAVALKQAYPLVSETGALELSTKYKGWPTIVGVLAVAGAVGFAVKGGKGALIGAGLATAGVVGLVVAGGYLI